MRKNLILGMMATLFSITATAQEWISFGSRAEGAPPEISVQRNDNQQVSFTLELSGMSICLNHDFRKIYKISKIFCPLCG